MIPTPNPLKLILIGGKPPPAGGVMSHVDDLMTRMENDPNSPDHVSLIDCYGQRDPVDSDPDVHYLHGEKGACFRLLLGFSGIIHMHLSTGRRIVPFMLAFKLMAPRARLMATFHHGDLDASWANQPFLLRQMTRFALAIPKKIICVSEKQAQVIKKYRTPSAIAVIKSYISRSIAGSSAVSPAASVLPEGARKHQWLVSSSGFAVRFYGFDQIIETVSALRKQGHDIGFCVVLYGIPDVEYLAELQQKVEKLDWVWIVPELSRQGFRSFLGETDLYLRATRKDSFGLAVCEALEAGTPVVASDVCERAEGAVIYPVDDQQEFSDKILQVLQKDSPASASDLRFDNYPQLMEVYREFT